MVEFWQTTGASSTQRTEAEKLWRAEDLHWSFPNLKFVIERHGGTVHGSSRADLHHWQVNVDTGQPELIKFGKRQLEPPGPGIDVRKLADEIARAIVAESKHEALKWIRAGEDVRVIASKIIPDNASEQTVSGRRRRFRAALVAKMGELGWENYKPYYYFRRKPGLA